MRNGGSRRRARALAGSLLLAGIAHGQTARAQEPPTLPRASLNLYGMTGLIDLPSARQQPDGQVSFTAGYFGPFLRTTLNFQILPRVEGTFRYSILDDFLPNGALYDRSFDVKFLVSYETEFMPAIAIGFQDMLGTGIYSAEYIVGTKQITPDLSITLGGGWGRLSDLNGVYNPFRLLGSRFDTREGIDGGQTGEVRFGNFFRGENMAFFGGLEWQTPVKGLTFKAEYSSDDYSQESRRDVYRPDIPFNFGLEYRPYDWLELGAYAMHGNEFGVRATFTANPLKPTAEQDADEGPLPLRARPSALTGPAPELGPVVERIGAEPVAGSDAASTVVSLDVVADGPRWAEATVATGAACPEDDALRIDRDYGMVDGVTFRTPSGRPVCTIVLRAEGREYVEASRLLAGGHPTGWHDDPAQVSSAKAAVRAAIEADRIFVEGIDIQPTRASVLIRNETYNAPAQAIGRVAVGMANNLPPSVEDLEITVREGPVSAVTVHLRRARLEAAASTPDASRRSWLTADVQDAPPIRDSGVPLLDDAYPRYGWYLNPDVPVNFFDPDSPVRAELRLRLGGSIWLAPGLGMSAQVSQGIIGNLDDITRGPGSALPHVRSDIAQYLREGNPAIDHMTGDYIFKATPEIYGRGTVGLLEMMYGGFSGEVLWKPVNQDWGVGAELNWVRQRDYDQLFSFRDYETLTGHASVYWDTGWHGMEVQVDAGRYLAEDWGATFSLTRRFSNGWEIGGFFTLTDVPFDEFGEGSFDKGLRLTIPLRWGLPLETRLKYTTVIRPLTRDGGARVEVPNRLWGMVRDVDRRALHDDWGNFWK